VSTSATKSTQIQLFGGSAFTVGLIFVTLKLAGVIAWPWWIVTIPFWGGVAFVFALVIIGFGLVALGAIAVAVLALISRTLSKIRAFPNNRNRRP
jgi:hypothetical protein